MKKYRQKLRERLFVEQAGRCFYCNCECIPTDGKKYLNSEQPDNLFTLDHIDAKSHGGRMTYSNAVGSCRRCNLKKGAKSMNNFRKENSIDGETVDPDMLAFPEPEWRRMVKRIKTEIIACVRK